MGHSITQDPNKEYVLVPKETLDAMIEHMKSEGHECQHEDMQHVDVKTSRFGTVSWYEQGSYDQCPKCSYIHPCEHAGYCLGKDNKPDSQNS